MGAGAGAGASPAAAGAGAGAGAGASAIEALQCYPALSQCTNLDRGSMFTKTT